MISQRLLSRPTVVFTIIKLNIFVFVLWILSLTINPNFMVKNFLVSWSGLMAGRVWTLVTSVFSHNMFFHIFLNMYAFFGFGTVVENAFGARRFIKFYLTTGVIASLSHCFVSAFLLGEPQLPALGASGAVSGVIILFSLMFPQERIFLMGFIPIPAFTASALIVGLDIWGLVAQARGGSLPIGHGAHLGGAFYGVFYYLVFIRKRRGLLFES